MGLARDRAPGLAELPRRVERTGPGEEASAVKRWLIERAIGLRLTHELPKGWAEPSVKPREGGEW
jgi:hypothetical protein